MLSLGIEVSYAKPIGSREEGHEVEGTQDTTLLE